MYLFGLKSLRQLCAKDADYIGRSLLDAAVPFHDHFGLDNASASHPPQSYPFLILYYTPVFLSLYINVNLSHPHFSKDFVTVKTH